MMQRKQSVELHVAHVKWPARFVTGGVYAGLLAGAIVIGLRTHAESLACLDPPFAVIMTVGKTAGLAAAMLVMLQLFLAARLKLVDRTFGLDRVMRFHKWSGAAALVLASAHPLLLYSTASYPPIYFSRDEWPLFFGGLGLMILVIVAGTSLFRSFLGLEYGAWRKIHMLFVLVAIIVSVHVLIRGSELAYGPPRIFWMSVVVMYIATFVWSGICRPILIERNFFTVKSIAKTSHNVHTIELKPLKRSRFTYLPGQFAFLTLRRKDGPVEEHPFTISSTPTRSKSISFTIKESGDYTSAIGNVKFGTKATVDGPYGRFGHLFHGRGDVLMIAGGIGITPMLSMLRYMVDTKDNRGIHLIWGNRKAKDIIFRNELDKMQSKLPNFSVSHVLSDEPDWEGETGFATEELLAKLLTEQDRGARVFLCGPPPMMKLAASALRKLGIKKSRIVTERFAL
ncbi:ferric reductase-like transmembrane domain-containing protein [Candidatus Hydrogenedentota bacterium]